MLRAHFSLNPRSLDLSGLPDRRVLLNRKQNGYLPVKQIGNDSYPTEYDCCRKEYWKSAFEKYGGCRPCLPQLCRKYEAWQHSCYP